jgi:uncharacterized lipoprotein YddW (UPF0748 family)
LTAFRESDYNDFERFFHIFVSERSFFSMTMKTFKTKSITKFISLFTIFTLLFSNFLAFPPKVNAVQEEMFVTAKNATKVLIDIKNVVRSGSMIVIYTETFGLTTKTNQWGIEIQVDASGIVTYVRNQGDGDSTGIPIPHRGYVLSSYGAENNKILTDNFKLGDKVSLNGVALVELNKTSSYEYSAIDPNASNNPSGVDASGVPFPGFRGADQIVAYTKDFGTQITGTNDYGFEVRVKGSLDEGYVYEVGGNNTSIPQDGFVLSGHGTGASFLINNAVIGAKININQLTKTLTASVTPESMIAAFEKAYTDSVQAYATAKDGLYDAPLESAKQAIDAGSVKLDSAKQILEQLKTATTNKQDLEFQFIDLLDEVKLNTNLVNYRSMESKKVESRAVWHRPTEMNLDDVIANLDELKSNNFNLIFLETFWQGYTIYPSKVPYVKQNPRFANNTYGVYGNDLLKAYIKEGEKRDIEIHAWCEDFFVGEVSLNPQSPILQQKPEWKLLNYDNSYISKMEGGKYLFMDPSIPEVRKLLLDLYSEIADTGIKGIQLDYIRYPVGEYKNDSGYGEYSMNTFKALYNIADNVDIRDLMDKDKNPTTWEEVFENWNKWKENNITSFVKSVRDELKAKNSNIMISTAIFPSTTEAIQKKMQNWPLWVQNGWIDITTPMAYFKDTDTVRSSVSTMIQYVNGKALNYAGIAPSFMGLEAKKNADQSRAAQLGHAQGVSIFASQNILGLSDVQEVLKESTFRSAAVLPNDDINKIIKTAFEDILSKADRIYIPSGKMSALQRRSLSNKLKSIENKKLKSSRDINKVENKIDALKSSILRYSLAPASNRIAEDLEYLNDILKVREDMLSRQVK